MPNTTSAAWTDFVPGTKIKSSQVDGNFDYSEHNLWPHSTGTKVDDTYNLGDTDAAWKTGYINSIVGGSTGVTIGTTTATQATSTALEIAGTKALLIPRITTAQRDSLTGVNGMMVYNSTDELYNLYENGAWRTMGNTLGFEATTLSFAVTATTQTLVSITSAGVLRGILGDASLGGAGPKWVITLDGITMTSAEIGLATTSTQYIARLSPNLAFDGTNEYLAATNGSDGNAIGLPFKTSLVVTIRAANNNAGHSVTSTIELELP